MLLGTITMYIVLTLKHRRLTCKEECAKHKSTRILYVKPLLVVNDFLLVANGSNAN